MTQPVIALLLFAASIAYLLSKGWRSFGAKGSSEVAPCAQSCGCRVPTGKSPKRDNRESPREADLPA